MNMDTHRRTAAFMFNVPEDEVTPEQRRAAKAVNFGSNFEIGSYSIVGGERLTGPNNAGDAFSDIRPTGDKIQGAGFPAGKIVDCGCRSGMSYKSNFAAMRVVYDLFKKSHTPLPETRLGAIIIDASLEDFDV